MSIRVSVSSLEVDKVDTEPMKRCVFFNTTYKSPYDVLAAIVLAFGRQMVISAIMEMAEDEMVVK